MSGVYVAFEGLKGSGKSTLVAGVRAALTERGVPFASVDPTRVGCRVHPLELLAHLGPLRTCDAFEERLYRHRARHHARGLLAPRVLGDRSVLTALVSRWTRAAGGREAWVAACLAGAPALRVPDVVVFVDVPPDLAFARCQARGRRYGRADETLAALQATRDAYLELRHDPSTPLRALRWHALDGARPREEVLQDAVQIVHTHFLGAPHV